MSGFRYFHNGDGETYTLVPREYADWCEKMVHEREKECLNKDDDSDYDYTMDGVNLLHALTKMIEEKRKREAWTS